MASVFISCGEPSGDLYAGALARELRRLRPGIRIAGLGGDHLREAGAELVGDYLGLAVTGLIEAVRVLPRAWATHRALVARAQRERPDALVVIDYPDFDFRLAGSLSVVLVGNAAALVDQLKRIGVGRVEVIRLSDLDVTAADLVRKEPAEEPIAASGRRD